MKDKEHYVIRLRFNSQPEQPDHFFGSLAAIYDRFSASQIGCAVNRLWAYKITPQKPFINKKCTISKEIVMHKNKKS